MEPNVVTPPYLSTHDQRGRSERRRLSAIHPSPRDSTSQTYVPSTLLVAPGVRVLCVENRHWPCALFPLALRGVNMLTKPAQVDGPDLSLAQLPALVGALVDAADRGSLLLGEPCRLPNRTEIGRLHVPPISRYPGHAAENNTPAFRASILDTANGRQVIFSRSTRPVAV
jgi:hypothetical protein